MRILLLLGDFGLPTMAALLASRYRPVGVVLATATEAPPPMTAAGWVRAWLRPLFWRGTQGLPPRDLRPWTAGAVLARAQVPYTTAKGLNTSDLCQLVETHRAELILSAGYPNILPPPVLSAPPKGVLNVHPSLLPRYRGPSPVFWQVALGETRSGATLHRMTPSLDEGPILSQLDVKIAADETAGALFFRLARLAAHLVMKTLSLLEAGSLPERPQDPALASVQYRFRDEDSLIDWARPAEDLARLVRACNPSPGARAFLTGGESVRIWRARALTGSTSRSFGEIVKLRHNFFDVTTGSGHLRVQTATSDRSHRFPAWGGRWPALVAGMVFEPREVV